MDLNLFSISFVFKKFTKNWRRIKITELNWNQSFFEDKRKGRREEKIVHPNNSWICPNTDEKVDMLLRINKFTFHHFVFIPTK